MCAMPSPVHINISGSFKLVSDELGRVKSLIAEQLAGFDEPVDKWMEHLNVSSGKMIRPALVLLAGAAVNRITDLHIHIAAIMEIIHNATLLHDDVIDQGRQRRGRPTANVLWGNESAVLLGDFLLTRVFEMCAHLQPDLTKIIADTTTRICKGELRQLTQKENWQLSESEYIDIITEKSAVLFSSCCLLGASLADGSQRQCQLLSGFGLDTGIAFQITDDLIDIAGDESRTGKTLGSDLDKNKPTLALIHLLAVTDKKSKSAIKRRLSGTEQDKFSPSAIEQMLRSSDSLEYVRRRAREFVKKAILSLADLRESDAKNALIETAGFVADRV